MANQRDFNIIERAGKRGAEIAGISRPIDAGMVSAAFTRDESFVDPDIDPCDRLSDGRRLLAGWRSGGEQTRATLQVGE